MPDRAALARADDERFRLRARLPEPGHREPLDEQRTHRDSAFPAAGGQAHQWVLLRAAERDLSAAFHTRAPEVPELRVFVRAQFCAGAYPQMLLRLGVPDGEELGTVRRPVEDVMIEEP